MSGRIWIVLGALLAAGAVAIGAYHAHGMSKWLEAQALSADTIAARLDNAATAVRYQMYHALGVLVIGLLLTGGGSRSLHGAGILMLVGIIGFSGGLYVIVFTGQAIHWAIVPAGGLALILAWLALAVGAMLSGKPH